MVSCSILGCKSRSEKQFREITFHRFPLKLELRSLWVSATGRQRWEPTKYSKICSKHFKEDYFIVLTHKTFVKPDAVPSIDIHNQNPEPEDEMDEGQEEWLSEGVLTDDDYNPATDQDQSDSCANMSQDDTMQSTHDSMESHNAYHDTGDSNARDGHEKDTEGNIEEALNNLENSQDKDFPNELGAFLIRKTDGKVLLKNVPDRRESEVDESTRQSDDDGNDTDELLRMLGEDGAKSKKKLALKSAKGDMIAEQSSDDDDDDDDEYVFEGAKVTRLKMAKNAFIKKYPTKAVPEEMSDKDDTDMSSDEVTTMKKMFGVAKQATNSVTKKTANIGGVNALQTIMKRVVSLDGQTERRQSTPHKQVVVKQIRKPEPKEIKFAEPLKNSPKSEEVTHEEEFLDEDFDLDEEMEPGVGDESSNKNQSQQRIMRPEQMDEEVPTDGDSQSEEDSLYDEMPSSESDELDEWFTLDIRAERAGDYLPLLGAKARQLLTTEKQRVSARLATLRQSLSALTESGRQQSEQLRATTATLAELDASLKAT